MLDDDSAWSINHHRKDSPSNPYAQVVALNACIQLKCNSMAGVPIRLSDADDNVIETGPDVELMNRPNKASTWPQFIKDTAGYYSVRGRSYWWRVTNGSRVLEEYVMNPAQMEKKFDNDGNLVKYHYHLNNRDENAIMELEPEDVCEIRNPDYLGIDGVVDPIKLAGQSIRQVYKAHTANEASLDNGMEPGGVLDLPTYPGKDKLRDLRQEINERHQGVGNRRNVLIMYGGSKFTPTQAMFKDMEFTGMLQQNKVEICVSQGVPPLLVYPASQSNLGSGKELEAHKLTLWESTLIPFLLLIGENWEMHVVDYNANDQSLRSKKVVAKKPLSPKQRCTKAYKQAKFNAVAGERDRFVWFDISTVPVIQNSMLETAEQAAKWLDRGTTLNEIYDAYDLPFEKRPWGDTFFIEAGKVDVRVKMGLIEDPKPAPSPSMPPAQEQGTDKPVPPTEQATDEPVADNEQQPMSREEKLYRGLMTKALSSGKKAAMWKDWYASWAPLRKDAEDKVKRHFFGLRSLMLEKAARFQTKGMITKDAISEILFDLTDANNGLLELIDPIIEDSFAFGGQQALNEHANARGLDKPDIFAIEDPRVVRSIAKRRTKIVDINVTLRKELRARMSQAVEAGEGAASLSDAIREQFNISTNRARTIAITEIGGAVEESRQHGRVQAKIPFKSWLHSRAEKGRSWHRLAEDATMETPIATDKKFTMPTTGTKMMYPRGSGVAKEDIRCGCTTISRYPDDKAMDLRNIYHLQTKGFTTYDEFCMMRKAA